MRSNERNEACPDTLGEYRDELERLAQEARIDAEDTAAMEFIDDLITHSIRGREEPARVPDSHMRNLLYPMLKQSRKKRRSEPEDESEDDKKGASNEK